MLAALPIVAAIALATSALVVLSCKSDGAAESPTTGRGGAGGTSMTGANGGAANGGAGGGLFLDVPDATPPDPQSALLADAGLFKCGGCACDGETHYCLVTGGLGIPPTPDAGVPLCPESDAGYPTGCVPLPASCDAGTSCACILASAPIKCPCGDVGGGLVLSCIAP